MQGQRSVNCCACLLSHLLKVWTIFSFPNICVPSVWCDRVTDDSQTRLQCILLLNTFEARTPQKSRTEGERRLQLPSLCLIRRPTGEGELSPCLSTSLKQRFEHFLHEKNIVTSLLEKIEKLCRRAKCPDCSLSRAIDSWHSIPGCGDAPRPEVNGSLWQDSLSFCLLWGSSLIR